VSAWTLLNTLYVMTEGSYLRLDNDTVRIEVEHETRLRVPIHHLCGIVTFGEDIMLSPALLGRCAQAGIGITLLGRHGRFLARIEGPMSGNVLLRRAQYDTSSDAGAALSLARSIVAGKLRNSRTVLSRGAREARRDEDREAANVAVAKFDASLRAVRVAGDVAALRGVEGEAARTYFDALNHLVRADAREAFRMDGRSRRPPRDALNALLSFLYTLLVHDCRCALETVGLDPQVGFLHVLRPGRPALALDLMEEFRAIAADRMALKLINRTQLKTGDFRITEGGGVLLSDEARKTVSIAWQERKKDTLLHPLLESEVPVGLLPQVQARLLARTLRGETEAYLPFIARWRVLVIVCYDVSTEDREGRRRLRRVALTCEAVGQRVQKSVFECRVDQLQLEALERNLLGIINPLQDCLRFYRLTEPVDVHVKEFGNFRAVDFDAPLVV